MAIGDVDGDERPDVYLVSGPEQNRLYRQVGDFSFTDVTDASRTSGGDAWGTGAAMVDVDDDGDGFCDLYVGNELRDGDRLYHNNGDGTFTDMLAEAASHSTWFSMGAPTWGTSTTTVCWTS